MEGSPHRSPGNMATITGTTTSIKPTFGINTVTSAQSPTITRLTSLSNPGTPNNQASYKTKDGLIRMLLQTATPTIPPPQQYISNQPKQPRDGMQNSSQLKIHGGGIGHYNNGHITQPHPSAIHQLPRTPVQLTQSSVTSNFTGQLASPSLSANHSQSAAANNMSACGSSQTNSPNETSSHSIKMDLHDHGTSTKTSVSHVVSSSIIGEKLVSAVLPSVVSSSLTNNACPSSDGNVIVLDEGPSRFIHQISETVIIAKILNM